MGFWDRVSVCSPNLPKNCNSFSSVGWVLQLQAWATMYSLIWILNWQNAIAHSDEVQCSNSVHWSWSEHGNWHIYYLKFITLLCVVDFQNSLNSHFWHIYHNFLLWNIITLLATEYNKLLFLPSSTTGSTLLVLSTTESPSFTQYQASQKMYTEYFMTSFSHESNWEDC